jgi:hypothetical protein
MINIKSLLFSVGLSSLLLSIGELPSNAQSFGGSSSSSSGGSSSSSSGSLFFTSPSLGTAGFVSGGGTTTSSGGVFSVPITFNGITGNIIVTPPTTPGTPATITVPPNILAAINNAGRNATVTIQSSGLTGVQIAQFLAAAPALFSNLTVFIGQGSISISDNSSSFTNLRDALRALISQLNNSNQPTTVTVGNITVTIE